jgi:mortality factor 4-like protein 1
MKLNWKLNAISWDEWVPASRLLKFTEENVRKQQELVKESQAQEKSAKSRSSQKPSKTGRH